jgi:hypothetical protein
MRGGRAALRGRGKAGNWEKLPVTTPDVNMTPLLRPPWMSIRCEIFMRDMMPSCFHELSLHVLVRGALGA